MELFMESGLPFSDSVKEGWTDDMVEFYEARVTVNVKNMSSGMNTAKCASAMEEEVGEDNSAHGAFITQNCKSSVMLGQSVFTITKTTPWSNQISEI